MPEGELKSGGDKKPDTDKAKETEKKPDVQKPKEGEKKPEVADPKLVEEVAKKNALFEKIYRLKYEEAKLKSPGAFKLSTILTPEEIAKQVPKIPSDKAMPISQLFSIEGAAEAATRALVKDYRKGESLSERLEAAGFIRSGAYDSSAGREYLKNMEDRYNRSTNTTVVMAPAFKFNGL